MDHRQARKTGWTIIVCGCFFIILSQLWVGLAMAALGLLLIILGGAVPPLREDPAAGAHQRHPVPPVPRVAAMKPAACRRFGECRRCARPGG